MATKEQLYQALRNADAAGDVEAARKIAAYIQSMSADVSGAGQQRFDPTEGMSTKEKVLAGIGKAFVDTGRGVGQLVGLVSDQDVAEARKLDAPLMNTGAGKVGNFAGSMAVALPTVLIPGANTVTGAALIGAAQGAIQPTVGDESRITNAGIGAVAGAGGIMAGRAIKGLYQGSKALVEPFTQSGRDKIAGRVLNRFAADADAVANATGGASPTGALPTLAEATRDRGIAQLQDALTTVDPQIGNRITARLAENNAARVNALNSLAGDSAKRSAAEVARETATAPLYHAATAKKIEITPELSALLKRPSVQKALGRAAALAKEDGRTFDLASVSSGAGHSHGAPRPVEAPTGIVDEAGNILVQLTGASSPKKVSGQTLQDLKMGMDALLKDPTSGIAGAEANAVKATRDALVNAMEQSIPEFGAARTGYASLSKPINGMDVGEFIANKATSNTTNLAGNPRMQANALLGMLRDEPALLKRATGRNELKSLSQVFEPDQINLLKAVAGETDRAAAVASAGNGPGSATAQRMASQNILRQLVGPTGLPESWAESALANTVIGKPFNLVYGGVAEPKIQQVLADALLEPDVAKSVMQAAARDGIRLPNNALTRLLSHSARVAPSTLAVTGER